MPPSKTECSPILDSPGVLKKLGKLQSLNAMAQQQQMKIESLNEVSARLDLKANSIGTGESRNNISLGQQSLGCKVSTHRTADESSIGCLSALVGRSEFAKS